MSLRKFNNFLICVGVLLSLSCLVFSLAYASNLKNESNVTVIVKQRNKTKNTIRHQQKEIKNSLRRMENKIKKRKKFTKEEKNVDNI